MLALDIAAPALFAQPQTPDDALRAQTQALVKRILATSDLDQQERLTNEILELDASHPFALQKLGEIREQRAAQTERQRAAAAEQARADQAAAQLRDAVDRARQAYARGVSSGRRVDIEEAGRRVQDVLTLAPAHPEALELQAALDAALASGRMRRIGQWVVLGVLLVGAAVAVWLRMRARPGQFCVIEGTQRGQVFTVDKDEWVIGASIEGVDLPIDDPSRRVSRGHCTILKKGRHHFIRDQSSNGTTVNNRQLPKNEPVLLRRGDRISLAGETVLLFR